MGHYQVGAPKTLPRRTLVAAYVIVSSKVLQLQLAVATVVLCYVRFTYLVRRNLDVWTIYVHSKFTKMNIFKLSKLNFCRYKYRKKAFMIKKSYFPF